MAKEGGEAKIWHLYILECEDGSFYTGISPDPQKRFENHQSGKGARYTKTHKPIRILVTEVVGSYQLALRREYQVKKQQKPGKLKYIANPASLPMPDLTAKWRKKPPGKRRPRPAVRKKKRTTRRRRRRIIHERAP